MVPGRVSYLLVSFWAQQQLSVGGPASCLPPWSAVGVVNSQSQALPVQPLHSLMCVCLSWPDDFSLFSLLWPGPRGWEEERAPSLCFNGGPVTAPSSGLVASERAVWEPGRVAPSGTAPERFPAEVAEVLRSPFSEAGSRVFIFFRKTEHSVGVLGLVFMTTLFHCGSAVNW